MLCPRMLYLPLSSALREYAHNLPRTMYKVTDVDAAMKAKDQEPL